MKQVAVRLSTLDTTTFAQRPARTLTTHLLVAFVALVLVFLFIVGLWVVRFLKEGPVLDRSRLILQQNIRIVDKDGGMLYQFSNGDNRLYLQTEEIPELVKNSVLAIEDERFYSRFLCVDIRALLRIAKVSIFDDRTEGASTITQQLTRMLYLSPEKTIKRKAYEILLSCRLEHLLTKDEILTLYLNGVSFGNGINGIEQAAQTYFGVPAKQLTIAQAAILAAMPQRPSYFSPYGSHVRSIIADPETLRALREGRTTVEHMTSDVVAIGLLPRLYRGKTGPARVPGRADAVLKSMRRLGMITQGEHDDAATELLHVSFAPMFHPIAAPHFSLWMRQQIDSLLQAVDMPERFEKVGLTVKTTLDPRLQALAEKTVIDAQPALIKANAKNMALVALDRRTRQIVAYVGNNDFFASTSDGQVDMIRVPRQPGSSFKPLVYATAFEHGFKPDSVVRDEPMSIGTDIPKNYEGGFKGAMTVRSALAQSRNIPAIKTFIEIGGEDVVLAQGEKMGVTTPVDYKKEMLEKNTDFTYGWPMAIGSVEIPLLEMVQMYSTIANNGVFAPLRELCSVTDQDGKEVLPVPPAPQQQAISIQSAQWMDSILRDSNSRPAGYWRSMLTIPGLNAAAKTGTSNVCFDRDVFGRCVEYGVNNVWTLGYTNDLVVGVWVGNADNSSMVPLADGLTVAAPIWHAFLEKASRGYDYRQAVCE